MGAGSDRTQQVEFDVAIVGYGPGGQACRPSGPGRPPGRGVGALPGDLPAAARGPSGPRDRGVEDPDDGSTFMEFSARAIPTIPIPSAPLVTYSHNDGVMLRTHVYVRNGARTHPPAEQGCASANHTTQWPLTSAASGSTAQHPLPWHRPTASSLGSTPGLTVGVFCLIASNLPGRHLDDHPC
jgi:hypothetical protein